MANEIQKIWDLYDAVDEDIPAQAWVMPILDVYMVIREVILWYFYPGGEDDLIEMQTQQALELDLLLRQPMDWDTFRAKVQNWVDKWKNRYHTELELAIPAWQIPTLRARITAVEGELEWENTPRRLARIESWLSQVEGIAKEAKAAIDGLLADKPWEGGEGLTEEDRQALDKLKASVGGFADLGSWWRTEWEGKLDNLTEWDLARLQMGVEPISTYQSEMLQWLEDAGRQNQLSGNTLAAALWKPAFDPTLTPENLWNQLAAKVFGDPAAEPGGPRRQAEFVTDAVFGLKHTLMEGIPEDAREF